MRLNHDQVPFLKPRFQCRQGNALDPSTFATNRDILLDGGRPGQRGFPQHRPLEVDFGNASRFTPSPLTRVIPPSLRPSRMAPPTTLFPRYRAAPHRNPSMVMRKTREPPPARACNPLRQTSLSRGGICVDTNASQGGETRERDGGESGDAVPLQDDERGLDDTVECDAQLGRGGAWRLGHRSMLPGPARPLTRSRPPRSRPDSPRRRESPRPRRYSRAASVPLPGSRR